MSDQWDEQGQTFDIVVRFGTGQGAVDLEIFPLLGICTVDQCRMRLFLSLSPLLASKTGEHDLFICTLVMRELFFPIQPTDGIMIVTLVILLESLKRGEETKRSFFCPFPGCSSSRDRSDLRLAGKPWMTLMST